MPNHEEFSKSDQAQLLRNDIREKLKSTLFEIIVCQDDDMFEPAVLTMHGYIARNAGRDLTPVELENYVEEFEEGDRWETSHITLGQTIYEITDVGVSDLEKPDTFLYQYQVMMLRAQFSTIHWQVSSDVPQPGLFNTERPDII